MKLARTSRCTALVAALMLAACSKEPVAPGVHTLSGHVKLTGFLVDAAGNFAGTRVVGDADDVPVELVFGDRVIARTLTVDGVYRFDGIGRGGYTARTAMGLLHDETNPLTIAHSDVAAADTLRLVAMGDLYPVPNPIGHRTTIYFFLNDTTRVDMRVVDLAGRPVRHVVDHFIFPDGLMAAGWDGRDDSAHVVPYTMFWLIFEGRSLRDTLGLLDERIHLLFR